MSISAACKSAGIARETYYDWTRRVWPKLRYHFESLKDDMRTEAVEDALYASAVSGDVNAQKNFLLNKRKNWRLGDPKDGKPAVVVQNNVTQNNVPAAKIEDEEELRKNADLIRKFKLTDRYGSPEGEGTLSGVCPEGQQRSEGSERTDSSGDSGTHSPVQEV